MVCLILEGHNDRKRVLWSAELHRVVLLSLHQHMVCGSTCLIVTHTNSLDITYRGDPGLTGSSPILNSSDFLWER